MIGDDGSETLQLMGEAEKFDMEGTRISVAEVKVGGDSALPRLALPAAWRSK